MTKPFIIWTARRTGGTNLADNLFDLSELQFGYHEPFNWERDFGYLSKELHESKDFGKFQSDLRSLLETKPMIKHCVELCSPEFNHELARVSDELGYNHLFLYRRTATDRLLSLNFASKTGIWGKEDRYKLEYAEYESDIDVKSMISDEKYIRDSFSQVFSILSDSKNKVYCACFEDIYLSDIIPTEHLHTILVELSGCSNSAANDVIPTLVRKGSQKTNQLYKKYPNTDELIKEAEILGEYHPFTYFDLDTCSEVKPNWRDLQSLRDYGIYISRNNPHKALSILEAISKEYWSGDIIQNAILDIKKNLINDD
ncbi:hypothetical protein [Vibrio parahaemolyticus]|uniref:hypothetical protein n=1 Tax=Vibrio parahaemolyticus TaxID=670 RepID=UPI000C1CC2BE|nr:hypothetical protein [Vibrio parahaemolyticus]PIS70227.1 hypothetical protein H271_10930 [Vibrio parahaemolyticus 1911C]